MPPHLYRRTAVLMMAALGIGLAAAQDAKGTFGLVAKVDADGFINPTLKSVFVQSVQPAGPAAMAGVVAGDSIIEVEGTKVAGAKASVVADRMKKRPGETVVLKLLRASGDTYSVTLTAVAAKS